MTSRVRRYQREALLRFGVNTILRLGAPSTTAAVVADNLVEADRRGVATHGLVRLASYRRQVEDGEIDPLAEPAFERDDGPTALVDGAKAFGALTGTVAMDAAIDRAGLYGVGVVAARRCTHFGTAAYYALRAARRGLIGVAATNTPGVMAPWGGADPTIGNNPFAIAAPLADGRPPFVLDMAQTVVARGRVKLAEVAGEPIPLGWGLDDEGRPTTDASAALAGALLPFGGYKGSGLALAIEALTGVLAGDGLSPELRNTSMTGVPRARQGARVGTVGNLYLAVDPGRFAGHDEYPRGMSRLLDAVKAVRPAPGFAEVLTPGEPEARAAQEADSAGVPLDEQTATGLRELARELDIPFPEPLP